MAKIIDWGDDAVHVTITQVLGHSPISLTIGVEYSPTESSRGKNRHTLLTAAEARVLAYALLSEAERSDQARESK